MSLETAAGTVAEQIRRQEFVEVYAHHDADGIAAASILCHAMLRAGIRFRLRIRQEISLSDLAGDAAYLLCDLGAGMEDLPRDVMVVDHHLPLSEGEFHVNPRLCGDRRRPRTVRSRHRVLCCPETGRQPRPCRARDTRVSSATASR